MQRYDSYKDSGIQWLGEIPSHWEVKRIASLGFFSKGGGFSRNDLVEEDGLPAILYGDIYTKYNIEASKIISKVKYEVEKYSVLAHKGDLLMTGSGETKEDIGKTIVLKTDSYIGGDVIRFSQKGHDSKFLSYFLNSQYAKAYRFRESKGEIIVHIYASTLKNMYISLPPLPEQQAIASYLDTATAKIDEAIAQQQKMIDLLNERKQIIINNAVTKGLTPNAPTKPSGIDWIGNIPEHWEIFKTLYALSMPITDGPHETPRLLESGIPFISAEAVSGGIIDFSHMRGYVSEAFYKECCKKYIPQLHDVYMIKSGATTGRTAIVETENIFTIWSPLAVFRANKKVINPYFLLNALRATYYTKQVELNWSYGTQQNIGMRILEKLLLCVPPLSEQLAIMKYIDSSIIPINKTIECAEGQISLLQERKQIIINEVVTGKVKV